MTAEQVLAVARKYIGYHETGDNLTKFAAELDKTDMYNGPKNGFPWCDLWCDYCVWEASGRNLSEALYVLCQPLKSAGAGCLYSAQYYKAAGRWSTTPVPGAQIFFSYRAGEVSHTGIVESVSGGVVTTIEGNTSDMVARRQYPVNDSRIYGYGLPRYDYDTAEEEPTEPTEPVEPETPEEPEKPTPAVCTVELPVLQQGDMGGAVQGAQLLLIGHGFYCGGKVVRGHEVPDGEFGPRTEEAARGFQRLFGLEIDGEIGCQTWAALIMR